MGVVSPFHFRLDRVLRVKILQVEELQQNLGKAERQVQEARRRLEKGRRALQERREELRQLRTGVVAMDYMMMAMEYVARLDRRVAEWERAYRTVVAARDASRQRLLEAVKERKMLETLSERDQASYQMEMNRREQRETDELALLKGEEKRRSDR